jgi:hypothetical protein
LLADTSTGTMPLQTLAEKVRCPPACILQLDSFESIPDAIYGWFHHLRLL